MVLQLADAADDKAYLGAVLAGEHAEAFFAGVPPTDLKRSNASLFALRERLEMLCAAETPAELCLWACRPQQQSNEAAAAATESGTAAQASARSVAFHVVFTQSFVVPAA